MKFGLKSMLAWVKTLGDAGMSLVYCAYVCVAVLTHQHLRMSLNLGLKEDIKVK
jgi:hypothetical protein